MNHLVIGIDNFYPSYDPTFKQENANHLKSIKNYYFYETDFAEKNNINKIIDKHQPETVIHLAALTGVRASLDQPELYYQVNTLNTSNFYKSIVNRKIRKFIYASSSSIYGNGPIPFNESQKLDPKSPYAKSKALAEHEIRKNYNRSDMSTVILRFFSVYGPNGRPDMAPYHFTESAFKHKAVSIFGDGSAKRDFTFVTDTVDAIIKSISLKNGLFTINLGNSSPMSVNTLIHLIEQETGKKLDVFYQEPNTVESKITYADISLATKLLGWVPKVKIQKGIRNFVIWYKNKRL
jgi:UDP-glucuronate 4-epimerase